MTGAAYRNVGARPRTNHRRQHGGNFRDVTMRVDAWPAFRIGDLGEVFTGRTPPTEHPSYFGDDFPFITPGDMRQGKFARATQRCVSHEGAELLKRIKIPTKSVCVSCIGWQMGEAIMTDKASFTNQQINTIVPNGKVDPSFLYYSLCPRNQELLSLGASTGVRTPILNKSAFCDLKVKIPPLPVQRRISDDRPVKDRFRRPGETFREEEADQQRSGTTESRGEGATGAHGAPEPHARRLP